MATLYVHSAGQANKGSWNGVKKLGALKDWEWERRRHD
jgi:hypothetical protein